MTGPVPEKRVAGSMDVIDEDEELCYIDDSTPMEISEQINHVPRSICFKTCQGQDQSCARRRTRLRPKIE
jgi:hypothetical protein